MNITVSCRFWIRLESMEQWIAKNEAGRRFRVREVHGYIGKEVVMLRGAGLDAKGSGLLIDRKASVRVTALPEQVQQAIRAADHAAVYEPQTGAVG